MNSLKRERDDLIAQLAVAGLSYKEIENAIRDESRFKAVLISDSRVGQIIRGYGDLSHYDIPLAKRQGLWARLRNWWPL